MIYLNALALMGSTYKTPRMGMRSCSNAKLEVPAHLQRSWCCIYIYTYTSIYTYIHVYICIYIDILPLLLPLVLVPNCVESRRRARKLAAAETLKLTTKTRMTPECYTWPCGGMQGFSCRDASSAGAYWQRQ